MKSSTFQNLTKLSLALTGALMLMGNQSCQKSQERELKKFVELKNIDSQVVYIPGGGSFDFKTVAREQMNGVLFDVGGFLSITPFVSNSDTTNLESGSYYGIQKMGLDGKTQVFSKTDQELMQKYSQATSDIQFSKEAKCFINMPHMEIRGSINGFEAKSSTGFSFGYSPTGPISIVGVDASVKFDSAQMDLSMMATHPMTHKVISAVNIDQKQTKTQFSIGLNLGFLRLGPSYYHKTPLAEVSKKALTKGLTALKTQMSNQEWYTRVLVNHDTHISIRGGLDVGLLVGDQLAVYNEMGYWIGEPCVEGSQYIGSAGNQAVAIIQLEAVGDSVSIGKVITQTDEAAVAGAKVRVLKLATPQTTSSNSNSSTSSGASAGNVQMSDNQSFTTH